MRRLPGRGGQGQMPRLPGTLTMLRGDKTMENSSVQRRSGSSSCTFTKCNLREKSIKISVFKATIDDLHVKISARAVGNSKMKKIRFLNSKVYKVIRMNNV